MAVFYHFFRSNIARFKKRAFSAAYCLENRWHGRFEIFCSSQTWNLVFIKYVSPEIIIISHFSNVFGSTFFHVLKGFFENFHVFLCAFWEELKKRMCVLSGIFTRTRQHWILDQKFNLHEIKFGQKHVHLVKQNFMYLRCTRGAIMVHSWCNHGALVCKRSYRYTCAAHFWKKGKQCTDITIQIHSCTLLPAWNVFMSIHFSTHFWKEGEALQRPN